ncbi:hypothetical protein BJP36_37605 [Moorena producens JHB]|uniref:Uncharacterized protein n=1 Tax=Moorena producens (strain JHB) TaxID=1454205 RepID=A0A9Q9SUF2_MOOP1|nr:hypothetical protein [Moorena producens]WAN69812.1 hypothetical protein BJP36_37605 [Moorena producens JHB]
MACLINLPEGLAPEHRLPFGKATPTSFGSGYPRQKPIMSYPVYMVQLQEVRPVANLIRQRKAHLRR